MTTLQFRPRQRWLLAASLAAIAAGSAGAALGQDLGTPDPRRSTGSSAAPAGSDSSLRLPPGLVGNASATASDPTPRSPASTSSSGAGRRPGLRENRARRSRPPAAAPVHGLFRSTLQPPGIATNVQPVQSGLPDVPVPPERPRRRPAPGADAVATVASTGAGLRDPALSPLAVAPKPVVPDPFAPLGVRVGNVLLYPMIGESVGYDTNPNRTNRAVGSFATLTEAELGIQSDWSRHELTGYLRGAYDEYPSNKAADRPEGAGRVGLRIDAARDTQLDAEGHFLIDTQRPGNPNLLAAVSTRPVVYTEGASVGINQAFNRLQVGLRGTVDRADFEDAKLGNGTVILQGDRNYTAYGGQLRLGYEIKPGFVPYLTGVIDTRQYDQKVDSAGYRRSSDGVSGLVGTTYELSRLLTADISAGVTHRTYQDPRLKDLTSPVANAALTYAMTPLTTVRATAVAVVDETTVPGANGIRTVRGTVEIAHALLRNLTLAAGVSAADYAYQGVSIDERGLGAFVRADYRINRNIALRASYTYDSLRSTVAGSSYVANVFLLGLRLNP